MGLWSWLRGGDSSEVNGKTQVGASPVDQATEFETAEFETTETMEFEITDVLDLHSFPPIEIKDVVRSYLEEASERGFRTVRIIHGRGVGVQRHTVRSLLERDERVVSFHDAEAGAGGWGATVVELR